MIIVIFKQIKIEKIKNTFLIFVLLSLKKYKSINKPDKKGIKE